MGSSLSNAEKSASYSPQGGMQSAPRDASSERTRVFRVWRGGREGGAFVEYAAQVSALWNGVCAVQCVVKRPPPGVRGVDLEKAQFTQPLGDAISGAAAQAQRCGHIGNTGIRRPLEVLQDGQSPFQGTHGPFCLLRRARPLLFCHSVLVTVGS